MSTQLYPMVQFAPDTWELDEFDCASVFVLVGEEKALVIDSGIGIGDLRGAVERITDKPLILALSHGHGDHIGNAWQFDEVYLNRKDIGYTQSNTLEMRKGYAAMIAKRQGGIYAYNPDEDILPPQRQPEFLPLVDGQAFDLGGRRVIAYECPGHTPGEMAFLDENTRTLFVGDAVNCNLLINQPPESPTFVSIERAGQGLKRLAAMGDRYDRMFNGHHDYRALGMPLGEDVLRDAIEICRRLVSGAYTPETVPSPFPGRPDPVVVKVGRTMITYNERGRHEPE